MPKVKFQYAEGNYEGLLTWDVGKKHKVTDFYVVTHPKFEAVEKQITAFLKRKRKFKIPESNKLDDYRVDNALPMDHETYFELAVNDMSVELGLTLKWEE